MIIVEGARNTGKTYLINETCGMFMNIKNFKFPFFEYYKSLDITSNNTASNYLTIGRDLTLIEAINQDVMNNDFIMDRGFISSVVFSKLFRDEKEENLVAFINAIKNKITEKSKVDIIYIEADEEARDKNNIPVNRDKDHTELRELVKNHILLPNNYVYWYNWTLEQLNGNEFINIHRMVNTFDIKSETQFLNIVGNIINN